MLARFHPQSEGLDLAPLIDFHRPGEAGMLLMIAWPLERAEYGPAFERDFIFLRVESNDTVS